MRSSTPALSIEPKIRFETLGLSHLRLEPPTEYMTDKVEAVQR
jgi:hypothetical protein